MTTLLERITRSRVKVKPDPLHKPVVTVRMSRELHESLRAAAHQHGISLNVFCTAALEHAVEAIELGPEESP